MDCNNLQAQPQQPELPIHQDQLFLQAFSTAANFSPSQLQPESGGLASATATAPQFSCGAVGSQGRCLKRPLCVTPPPPSTSPSSDKDVHMDTPTAKKPKPGSWCVKTEKKSKQKTVFRWVDMIKLNPARIQIASSLHWLVLGFLYSFFVQWSIFATT